MEPNQPSPPPAPFGAPAYTPAPPPQGNGIAVAGMVLGIVSIVLCWAWFLGGILALLGIIFGALGMSKAKRIGGRGKGAALAGLICGVVGLVLAIVVIVIALLLVRGVESTFEAYAQKAKASESTVELHNLGAHIQAYYMEKATLPPNGPLTPQGDACDQPGKKFAPVHDWTGGWAELGFSVDEPSYFQYRWTRVSDTEGYAEAIGDLDCDGTKSTRRVDIHVVDGTPTVEVGQPTPD